MAFLVDAIYLAVALLTAPIWLTRMIRTGKIRTDWRGRFGRAALSVSSSRPRILIHAVSVGEVNAVRLLVDELAASPMQPDIVIASTTDTGFARAGDLWRGRNAVVRYPFDFSWAVRRFLKAIQPDVVVLAELEIWPNFTAACARRGIPVCIVNGRLTKRSFKRYRLLKPLIRPVFQRLSFAAVQTAEYAQRFVCLGVASQKVSITGTMKWDTAQIADQVEGAETLARELGIDRSRPLIVAGSTAPEEHALLHAATPPGVQLLCAPRKPEWFEQAARDLPGCTRRSEVRGQKSGVSDQSKASHLSASSELRPLTSDLCTRFLLDTIGELRKAYALADVVVIGRSFGNLDGSDMMEPIALGKATVVGPRVADFQDVMDSLLAGDGVVQTNAANLSTVLNELLMDPARRRELAFRGRAVIRAQQGATAKNAALIADLLH